MKKTETPTEEIHGSGADAYLLKPIPRFRDVVIDAVYEGHKVPKVHGLLQCPITGVRARFSEIRARGGTPPSMTAYIVYCVARAAAQNPGVHAIRRKRKLVLFSEVDLSTAVERRVDAHTTVPASLVLRSANRMSLREIHDTIRAAQKAPFDGISLGDDSKSRRASMLAALPRLLRKPVWWKLRRDPLFRKRTMGTVNVTAVGMFAKAGIRGWGMPVGSWPLTVTVGTIDKGFVPDKTGAPEAAEFVNLTMTVDHTSIDGAPAARFAAQLNKLLASGAGLDDYSGFDGAADAAAE